MKWKRRCLKCDELYEADDIVNDPLCSECYNTSGRYRLDERGKPILTLDATGLETIRQ